MRKRTVAGIGILVLALGAYTVIPRKITPLSFHDVNHDNIPDAIVCWEESEFNMTRLKYDWECIREEKYRYMITSPSELSDTFVHFGYIDGTKLKRTDTGYQTRARPVFLTKRVTYQGIFKGTLITARDTENTRVFLEVTPADNPEEHVRIPLFEEDK
ncbi:hypothetical protein HYZ97_02460 [Candidatus Pacearchaeota archaeon]|nr:hypothetical protein [Candidatus Pacearchaeota archaeon]